MTFNQDDWIKAGKLAREALMYGKEMIKPGASLLEVSDKVEAFIKKNGAIPAFPTQISCNHIAAHYCADPEDPFIFDKEVVSLDVGVCINGAIGDNAVTVDLSGEYTDLIEASRDALKNVSKIIQIGTTLSEIGRTVQDTIGSYGFAPVKNLSGHGLGHYNIHTKPSIPNFDTGDETELTKGMTIAIEPFASTGKGLIHEAGIGNIFALVDKKPVRSPFAREILKEIETYKGLPFTTRWLVKKFGQGKTRFALKELMQKEIIRDYPPLPDVEGGFVSQAEHSFLIDDKVIVLTKE